MAASSDNSGTSTPTSTDDGRQQSPTDTTRLMSNGRPDGTSHYEVHRWVFASPNSRHSGRRYHSPRIYTRSQSSRSMSPPNLTRSVSEDGGMNSQWNRDSYLEGPLTSASVTMSNMHTVSSDDHLPGDQTPASGRPTTRHSRTASHGGSTSASHRTASFLSEIRPSAILSRSSTRRSLGREWTRNHWEKVRDLEQESERAKRCSKLSSGFAPLMVFGGLVFICIGVSAATNTGKDKDRLRSLSAAPMAMGVFMLVLGVFLIGTWFGCRSRAKKLEQRLLHGSRRNSVEENLVRCLISKLQLNSGTNRAQTSSPTLPGVTLDGVNVLKPQSDHEARRPVPQGMECGSNPGSNPESNPNRCCTHCGAANQTTHVVLETAI